MRRASVFGLDVWTEETLPFLEGSRASATGRVLDVLVDRRAGVCDWPSEARLISEQHEPDGTPVLGIQAHPEAGYRLAGPRYGSHILSPDGRRLRCTPGAALEGDWHRFVIAQVLPFAAALNRLEVLHASAVSLDGRGLALLGPSGAGKTSLALALCRQGAEFLADDVLALERLEGELLAHPGTPAAGVAREEAERLGMALGANRVLAVDERERLICVQPGPDPAVLGALLFLHRDLRAGSAPVIERERETRTLLASTFNFVLDDPARLQRLLDVCAIAAQGAVARVSFGPGCDPDRLAFEVARWFESLS